MILCRFSVDSKWVLFLLLLLVSVFGKMGYEICSYVHDLYDGAYSTHRITEFRWCLRIHSLFCNVGRTGTAISVSMHNIFVLSWYDDKQQNTEWKRRTKNTLCDVGTDWIVLTWCLLQKLFAREFSSPCCCCCMQAHLHTAMAKRRRRWRRRRQKQCVLYYTRIHWAQLKNVLCRSGPHCTAIGEARSWTKKNWTHKHMNYLLRWLC